MNFRLAIIAKHPVHTQLPLYKRLAKHDKIDLTMFLGSSFGMFEGQVPVVQRGITVKMYSTPDLSDINHKYLQNYGTSPAPSGFWSPIAPGIFRELRKSNFDAILIHGYGTLMDIVAYLAASITKTPVLMMGETYIRPDRTGWKRKLKDLYVRNWLRGVAAYLPIGTVSKQFYQYHNVPEEKIFVAPYSVENKEIIREAADLRPNGAKIKQEFGIKNDNPNIIFVGRLIDRKHPIDLIDAFQSVQEKANLLIVGDGPEQAMLRNFIAEHHIQNVHLVGYTPLPETKNLYSVSDIFVLPSSYEPWGFVVNEAMCFGLPIIAADGVAAAFDLVHQGENGYIYPSRDVSSLSRHLEEMILEPQKRVKMGQRSIEIIENWNYESAVESIVEALQYIFKEKEWKD